MKLININPSVNIKCNRNKIIHKAKNQEACPNNNNWMTITNKLIPINTTIGKPNHSMI